MRASDRRRKLAREMLIPQLEAALRADDWQKWFELLRELRKVARLNRAYRIQSEIVERIWGRF